MPMHYAHPCTPLIQSLIRSLIHLLSPMHSPACTPLIHSLLLVHSMACTQAVESTFAAQLSELEQKLGRAHAGLKKASLQSAR